MRKTFVPSGKNLERKWHLLDAKGKVLGRFAVEAAGLLMGKSKVDYMPNLDRGDYVVVVNAREVVVSGGKKGKKVYRRHSQYPGGLKEESLASLIARKPERVIELAVSGMLPKNKLRKLRLARLKVFGAEKHLYEGKVNRNDK